MANVATKMTTEGGTDAQRHQGTEGGGGRFRVHVPLIQLTKAQIIRRGVELGVDYGMTHSCYDPDDRGRACGRCDSCVLRKRGFREAGVPDPTSYVV
jgi:7-cyano-7-deazaguanine synthase